MSPDLPSLRSDELIRLLEKAGFEVKRQTGSHVVLYKEGLRRPVTVPAHRRDLPVGTQRAILRQAGVTVAEAIELLKQ